MFVGVYKKKRKRDWEANISDDIIYFPVSLFPPFQKTLQIYNKKIKYKMPSGIYGYYLFAKHADLPANIYYSCDEAPFVPKVNNYKRKTNKRQRR